MMKLEAAFKGKYFFEHTRKTTKKYLWRSIKAENIVYSCI